MKWTTTRLVWACALATQPVGLILLLAHFMPRWEQQDRSDRGVSDGSKGE